MHLLQLCRRIRPLHGQRAVLRLSWNRNTVVQRTVKRDIFVRATQVHLPLTLVALPNASRKSWLQGVPRLGAQEFKVDVAAILNFEEIRRHIAYGFYCDLSAAILSSRPTVGTSYSRPTIMNVACAGLIYRAAQAINFTFLIGSYWRHSSLALDARDPIDTALVNRTASS